jgi:flagellar basal body-associated protein FliL
MKILLSSTKSRRNSEFSLKIETQSKERKLADEAQQRLDPLRSALMEHLLEEVTFQHVTGNEAKQVFKVSTLWNEIALKLVKCGAKLKLKIRSDDDAGKLMSIKKVE